MLLAVDIAAAREERLRTPAEHIAVAVQPEVAVPGQGMVVHQAVPALDYIADLLDSYIVAHFYYLPTLISFCASASWLTQ